MTQDLRILFIQPPFSHNRNQVNFTLVCLPLGIATVAAYVRKYLPTNAIEILDAHALDLSDQETVNQATQKEWDVIAFAAWTGQSERMYEIATLLRPKTKAKIIFGGSHPSTIPEEATKFCDYVVINEGEATFLELCQRIKDNLPVDSSIDGIAYRTPENRFVQSKTRKFIEDLDTIPMAAFDLLDMDLYKQQIGENIMHVTGGTRLPILCTRGCPYGCTYCVSPIVWEKKVRYRSVEHVIAEIKHVGETYGIYQFHFWDDNLLIHRQYILKLCDRILEEGLDIKWTGLTRAEHIIRNKDILPYLRKAGLLGVEIGIESANPETLHLVNKGQTVTEIGEATKAMREAGMTPLHTLMAFNVGENITGYYMQNTFLNKIYSGNRENRLYIGQFATTYPKTKFLADSNKLGLKLERGWGEHVHNVINFVPQSLLDEKPLRTCKRFRLEDYPLILYYSKMMRFDAYPMHESKVSHAKRLMIEARILPYYHSICDGTHTVEEIMHKCTAKFKLDFIETARFIAFATLCCAQLGIIESANNKPQGMVTYPKQISLVRKNKKVLFSIIRGLDKLRGNPALTEKERKVYEKDLMKTYRKDTSDKFQEEDMEEELEEPLGHLVN